MDQSQYLANREEYVLQRIRFRDQTRKRIESTIATVEKRLFELNQEESDLVRQLQEQPERASRSFFKAWRLQAMACAEFDALVKCPHVSHLLFDRVRGFLLVETLPVHNRQTLELRIYPQKEALVVNPPVANGLRVLLNSIAPPMIAAGALAPLTSTVVSLFHLSERHSAPPRIQKDARADYICARVSRLAQRIAPDYGAVELERALACICDEKKEISLEASFYEQVLAHEYGACEEEKTKTYEMEFDLLSSQPQIERIVVNGGTVRVFTRTFTIPYREKHYILGPFRVNIGIGTALVKIDNLKNPIFSDDRVYAHPHVRNGEPCLGNIEHLIAQRLTMGDVATVVSHILALLSSYNEDSPHRKIHEYWTADEDTSP